MTDPPASASEAVGPPLVNPELIRRCFKLMEEHWAELSKQIGKWLNEAFGDDESLVDEVALLMLEPSRKGSRLARALRDVPSGDPSEKGVLFANAKWTSLEVASSHWEWKRRQIAALRLAGRPAPSRAKAAWTDAEIDDALNKVFEVGRETLRELRNAGLLDASWSDDEQWTLIGLIFGFTPRHIARIRHRWGGADVSVLYDGNKSTYRISSKVRRKAEKILALIDVGGSKPLEVDRANEDDRADEDDSNG